MVQSVFYIINSSIENGANSSSKNLASLLNIGIFLSTLFVVDEQVDAYCKENGLGDEFRLVDCKLPVV